MNSWSSFTNGSLLDSFSSQLMASSSFYYYLRNLGVLFDTFFFHVSPLIHQDIFLTLISQSYPESNHFSLLPLWQRGPHHRHLSVSYGNSLLTGLSASVLSPFSLNTVWNLKSDQDASLLITMRDLPMSLALPFFSVPICSFSLPYSTPAPQTFLLL